VVDTQQLKAINIKDVWQSLGYELRNGSNARCFGPSHANGDRNPSLGFDSRTNRFKCFSCELSGDTIELVMQAHGTEFKEAVEWLGSTFGVSEGNNSPSSGYITRTNSAKQAVQPKLESIRIMDCAYRLPKHVDLYTAFYEACEQPKEDLVSWWQGRGLSDELLRSSGWRSITRATWEKMAEQFTSTELLDAGLLTERNDKRIPLFYNHTVVVPYFDGDQLIYLRARSLDPKTRQKYLGPRGESVPLYNYTALFSYSGGSPLYVTESETDTLALTEQGKTCIALAGASKNASSVVVRELVNVITECFDSTLKIRIATDKDKAGNRFFAEIGKALYLAGVPKQNIIKYQCRNSEHKDVAECHQRACDIEGGT